MIDSFLLVLTIFIITAVVLVAIALAIRRMFPDWMNLRDLLGPKGSGPSEDPYEMLCPRCDAVLGPEHMECHLCGHPRGMGGLSSRDPLESALFDVKNALSYARDAAIVESVARNNPASDDYRAWVEGIWQARSLLNSAASSLRRAFGDETRIVAQDALFENAGPLVDSLDRLRLRLAGMLKGRRIMVRTTGGKREEETKAGSVSVGSSPADALLGEEVAVVMAEEYPGTVEGEARRCPYCLDQVGAAEAWRCGSCGSWMHEECRREMGECAVFGCGGR